MVEVGSQCGGKSPSQPALPGARPTPAREKHPALPPGRDHGVPAGQLTAGNSPSKRSDAGNYRSSTAADTSTATTGNATSRSLYEPFAPNRTGQLNRLRSKRPRHDHNSAFPPASPDPCYTKSHGMSTDSSNHRLSDRSLPPHGRKKSINSGSPDHFGSILVQEYLSLTQQNLTQHGNKKQLTDSKRVTKTAFSLSPTIKLLYHTIKSRQTTNCPSIR